MDMRGRTAFAGPSVPWHTGRPILKRGKSRQMKTLRQLLDESVRFMAQHEPVAIRVGSFVCEDLQTDDRSDSELRRDLVDAIEELAERFLLQGLAESDYETRAWFFINEIGGQYPSAYYAIKNYIQHLQAQIALLSRDTGYVDGYEAGRRDESLALGEDNRR